MLIVLAVLLGWGWIMEAQAESKFLKLGVINPLTGPAAQWGLNTKCAMPMTGLLEGERIKSLAQWLEKIKRRGI